MADSKAAVARSEEKAHEFKIVETPYGKIAYRDDIQTSRINSRADNWERPRAIFFDTYNPSTNVPFVMPLDATPQTRDRREALKKAIGVKNVNFKAVVQPFSSFTKRTAITPRANYILDAQLPFDGKDVTAYQGDGVYSSMEFSIFDAKGELKRHALEVVQNHASGDTVVASPHQSDIQLDIPSKNTLYITVVVNPETETAEVTYNFLADDPTVENIRKVINDQDPSHINSASLQEGIFGILRDERTFGVDLATYVPDLHTDAKFSFQPTQEDMDRWQALRNEEAINLSRMQAASSQPPQQSQRPPSRTGSESTSGTGTQAEAMQKMTEASRRYADQLSHLEVKEAKVSMESLEQKFVGITPQALLTAMQEHQIETKYWNLAFIEQFYPVFHHMLIDKAYLDGNPPSASASVSRSEVKTGSGSSEQPKEDTSDDAKIAAQLQAQLDAESAALLGAGDFGSYSGGRGLLDDTRFAYTATASTTGGGGGSALSTSSPRRVEDPLMAKSDSVQKIITALPSAQQPKSEDVASEAAFAAYLERIGKLTNNNDFALIAARRSSTDFAGEYMPFGKLMAHFEEQLLREKIAENERKAKAATEQPSEKEEEIVDALDLLTARSRAESSSAVLRAVNTRKTALVTEVKAIHNLPQPRVDNLESMDNFVWWLGNIAGEITNNVSDSDRRKVSELKNTLENDVKLGVESEVVKAANQWRQQLVRDVREPPVTQFDSLVAQELQRQGGDASVTTSGPITAAPVTPKQPKGERIFSGAQGGQTGAVSPAIAPFVVSTTPAQHISVKQLPWYKRWWKGLKNWARKHPFAAFFLGVLLLGVGAALAATGAGAMPGISIAAIGMQLLAIGGAAVAGFFGATVTMAWANRKSFVTVTLVIDALSPNKSPESPTSGMSDDLTHPLLDAAADRLGVHSTREDNDASAFDALPSVHPVNTLSNDTGHSAVPRPRPIRT